VRFYSSTPSFSKSLLNFFVAKREKRGVSQTMSPGERETIAVKPHYQALAPRLWRTDPQRSGSANNARSHCRPGCNNQGNTPPMTNTTKQSRQQPGLLPSKPPPWKYKNLYHQTRRLLLFILLRPDASTFVFHPPSTSRNINWSAPSNTAQFNTPSKPHSPRTAFNRKNHNRHRPSTPTISPHQFLLPELSITTLPTTIPIRNTRHGQKPHGKARTTLRHQSREDPSTNRFRHYATTNQTSPKTVQESSIKSSYLIRSSSNSSQISITSHQIFPTTYSRKYSEP
jgi:hypothetical protein